MLLVFHSQCWSRKQISSSINFTIWYPVHKRPINCSVFIRSTSSCSRYHLNQLWTGNGAECDASLFGGVFFHRKMKLHGKCCVMGCNKNFSKCFFSLWFLSAHYLYLSKRQHPIQEQRIETKTIPSECPRSITNCLMVSSDELCIVQVPPRQ